MMNIQPGGSGVRRSVRRESQDNSGGVKALCGLLARVMHTALFIAVVGIFFHTYIKLEQDCDAVILEIREVNERITGVEREIEGLRVAYADRSSRGFINRQIARFKLPLVPTRYEQRQPMRVFSSEQLARIAYPMPGPQVAADNRRIGSRRGRR